MVIFNLVGLLGMAVGVGAGALAAFAAGWLALPLGDGRVFVYSVLLGILAASLFGLTIDRCDRHGVWAGYKANLSQFFREFSGQPPRADIGYNPQRRTAFCIWPLALGPGILLVAAIAVWVVDLVGGYRIASHLDYAAYCAATALAVGGALFYAQATRDLRYVGGEASTDVPPQPVTLPARMADTMRKWSPPQAPTRRVPLVLFLLGAGSLVMNHIFVLVDGSCYPAIVLAGPLLMMPGLGGIIDPRTTWALRAEGSEYPRWVRLAAGGWLLAGVVFAAILAFGIYGMGR